MLVEMAQLSLEREKASVIEYPASQRIDVNTVEHVLDII
jgi:hypothetical protein